MATRMVRVSSIAPGKPRRKSVTTAGSKNIFTISKERHDLKAIDEMQAMGVTTVAPRASAPVRKTRLRNRSTIEEETKNTHTYQDVRQDLQGVDRRGICEDILVGGYVQTFVDFFYLTHRPGPPQDNVDPREITADINVSQKDMLFIRDNLIAAESARRRGDTSTVYEAFNSLAQYYQDLNDPKTGVYFHEKCLEISRLTGDRRGEMKANHRLGLVYDKMGDVAVATTFHERHQELAEAVDISEEQKTANVELVKVYRTFAEERECMGDYSVSVEYWAKSLDAARAADDRAALGQACYRLGKAYTELGEPNRAVNYLQDFQGISTELDDLEGQGRSYEALAAAYQSLGNDEKALSLLQQCLDVATKTQNLGAQEAACSNLGVLYSRRGQHSKAKEMFERNFIISRKVVGTGPASVRTDLVDTSRAFLGIAAGNEMAAQYINAVVSDLGALLDWKSSRVRLKPVTAQDANKSREKSAH